MLYLILIVVVILGFKIVPRILDKRLDRKAAEAEVFIQQQKNALHKRLQEEEQQKKNN